MQGLHLSRRQVLSAMTACGLAAAAGCRSGGGGTATGAVTPAPTGAGTTGALPAGLQVARRFSFGPTQDLVDLAAAGPGAFLDSQLDPARPEDPSVLALVHSLDARLAAAGAADPTSGATGANLADRRAAAEVVIGRTLAIGAWSERQLGAVLADFFADHLHVSIAEAPDVFHVPAYDRDVIRAEALGRFADLLVASARSAAMLVSLDNARSRADGGRVPNENYARELLELHTVGVDGGYDEADVVEAAHVLSGWTLQRPGATYRFEPAWHDLGPAAGGDVLGWRPSARGESDGEDLLHHLARHPAAARFITWKLARRFVADDVRPDSGLVDRLADTYMAEDTEVGPVLRELVASEEFAGSGSSKVRRPLDLVTAMLRMGTEVPVPGAYQQPVTAAARALQVLGQLPYRWPAPDGYPEAVDAWSGAGALVGRWNTAAAAAGGFGGLALRAAEGSGPVTVARALLGADPGPALATALGRVAPGPAAGPTAHALTYASPEFQQR